MQIVTAIKTSHHPRLVASTMIPISVTPGELHSLILIIERDAAEAEREGQFSAGDQVAYSTLALRRATRMRGTPRT